MSDRTAWKKGNLNLLLFASYINELESSIMKCVLLGLFGILHGLISAAICRTFVSINPLCKGATLCLKVP